MENIENTIKLADEKLVEIRAAKKALEQERAMAEMPVENRSANKEKFYAKLQDDLKNNRSVTVSGTETVNVASDLVYALEDSTDLLNRFSMHIGASANNVIPVWNNADVGEFAPVAEDGTFDTSSASMATTTVQPRAFAKSIRVADEVLKLSAVKFEAELTKILTKASGKTILKQIFTGSGANGQFTAIDANATEIEVPALNASAIHKMALTVGSKTTDGVMLINPLTYGSIGDSATKKDEILMKQIMENKNVEGVELILSPYVPEGKVIAGCLGNYAIGIANQLDFTRKETVGTLAHTYDSSIYIGGKPIVAEDFYTLKITG